LTKVGDKVVGGETVIARLTPAADMSTAARSAEADGAQKD
jgi:hypothetical protein